MKTEERDHQSWWPPARNRCRRETEAKWARV